jgi:hypothetical protein
MQENEMHGVTVTTGLMLVAANSEFATIIGIAEDALTEGADDDSLEDFLVIVLGCEI